jgi:MFS family permease
MSDGALSDSNILTIWAVHFAVLIISLIGGALLVKKVNREAVFLFWIILGVVSPLTLLLVNLATTFPIMLLLSGLLGFALGIGMPNCMTYFTQSTEKENRGRYGGAIMFSSAIGFFALALINAGSIGNVLLLSIWRLTALLAFFYARPFHDAKLNINPTSFRTTLTYRPFILYLAPWIMFSLVNYLSTPVQNNVISDPQIISTLSIIGNAIGGVSALIAGFFMDYLGRKQVAIAGFALLGLSFSILGIFPTELFSWYIYMILDGLTWGVLIVLFVVTIWGDLSQSSSSDTFYALGVLPFFFSRFLQIALGTTIANNILPTALFSFIAFFLFLAVLPLVYAPETLPEKVMKDRDLKSYIENAKKKAQKESGMSHKKKKPLYVQVNEELQPKETNEEYRAAKKLAEKYY